MPEIHPTAIVDENAVLAEDCVIGPGCVLTGKVEIGPGTRLIGSVYLNGPMVIGESNLFYPYACIGFAPQDLKWDVAEAGAGVRIGDNNTFREQVTIHRATSHETPTAVGDENFFMATSHVGHDCSIGKSCVFANSTLLAGHVKVGDRVITGGNTSVHQHCRIGRGAMLSGQVGMGLDLPPYFTLTGINIAGSVNLVGLRRSGMNRDEIEDVRWVYRTLCRSGLSIKAAADRLREREDRAIVAEYIRFIEATKRGIVTARGKASRGMA